MKRKICEYFGYGANCMKHGGYDGGGCHFLMGCDYIDKDGNPRGQGKCEDFKEWKEDSK